MAGFAYGNSVIKYLLIAQFIFTVNDAAKLWFLMFSTIFKIYNSQFVFDRCHYQLHLKMNPIFQLS